MNKKHLYIIIAILLSVYGIYVVYSMYNKPHKIISEQVADFHISADVLMKEFEFSEDLANTKYFDKIIVIEGNLKLNAATDSELSYIILKGENVTVNCEMSVENNHHNIQKYNDGEKLFVKGLFVGYDDLLGELQLKKCTIISKDSEN